MTAQLDETGPRRRPRRSCLAVPGSSPRMMEKAAQLDCDQVFFDLEDAVAPNRKAAARGLVVEALAAHDFGEKLCVVRVNAVGTPYVLRDIVEVVGGAGTRLDAVMVPKVAAASHVHFVDHLLSSLEQELGLARRIGLEILIEDPRGATSIREIATASERIETLVFGVGDYQISMGIPSFDLGRPSADFPDQWQWTMGELANHARAVGAQPIDGPYVAIDDREGYLESARRSRLLGFVGKWCIHPKQIAWANEGFSPSEDDLGAARAVLDAYKRAARDGVGATVVDGLMIDEASRKLAVELLSGHAVEPAASE